MPLLYPNGAIKYEGDLVNNRPHGLGVLYYENGNKKYEGNFVEGNFVEGAIYYHNGRVWYEGKCFNDEIKEGEGVKYFYEEDNVVPDNHRS